MTTDKIYKLILIVGIIGSFVLSLVYLLKSYSSLQFDDNNFIFNTSILFSNTTSLVILIYLIRRVYLTSKKTQSLLFSKYMLFGLLIFLTLPLEIVVYNIYKYDIKNFAFEKLTLFLFGIACLALTIYMIKGKDIDSNVA